MPELQVQLQQLGAAIEYPPTPDLQATVLARLEQRPRGFAWRRPLVLALTVAIAALAATLAFSPGARSAFLELFHLKGVTVERVEELPEVEVRRPFDLGARVTLAEAQRQAGFRLLRSDELGEPDAVYTRDGFVTFLYGDPERPRLLLSQFQGQVDEQFVKKFAKRTTTIQFVSVGGGMGLFLSGADHFFWFLTRDGRHLEDVPYLAGNTLLWERGPITLRLEADLTRAEAVELAESVR